MCVPFDLLIDMIQRKFSTVIITLLKIVSRSRERKKTLVYKTRRSLDFLVIPNSMHSRCLNDGVSKGEVRKKICRIVFLSINVLEKIIHHFSVQT